MTVRRSLRMMLAICSAASTLIVGFSRADSGSDGNGADEVLVVGQRQAGASAESHLSLEAFGARGRANVADAVSFLPEAAPARAGTRNERTIRLRGFDMRQVPLFVDGIPVYLPYDGMVDPGRFWLLELAELHVSRGFSSISYGPNALGGVINAVSARPAAGPSLEAGAGLFSGDGCFWGTRASAAGPSGYVQGSVAYSKRKYFRVSSDSPAADAGERRENSDESDLRLSLKGAWVPSDGNEYVIGFIRIDSEKGVPPYAGSDERNKPKYWRYTDWKKNSIYLIGHSDIGFNGCVKTRLYYDTYANTLDSYDDANYDSQTKPYAFRSFYDDYAFGGALEASAGFGANLLRAVLNYKQDVHRELYEEQSRFSDHTLSVALEDEITISEAWTFIAGMSWDRRESLEAEDKSGSEPISHSDNANDIFNPQCGLFYNTGKGIVRATAARKSRFPTMKDRYSYRLGTTIPNPSLKPEQATHYEIGYVGEPIPELECRLSLFFSRLKDAIQQEDNVRHDDETDEWLGQYRNIGEAEHKGLEAGLAYSFAPQLKVGADYALLDIRNIARPDMRPTDAPTHRLLSFLEVRPIDKLAIIPNIEFASSRYSTSDGVKTDGFWLCNLDLALTLPCGLELAAGTKNIFDIHYELSEGYPEEGRSYHAEINYRF